MGRLTIEKDVKEMSMYELTHNSCYAKDGMARYRDYETDIDCRDFARKLMVDYGLWKGIPEHGLDANNELVDDDIFDESILDSLQYDPNTLEGLIALFYRNLWAMADLRTILKKYEDLEEQGRLIELPCAVGDTVYLIEEGCEDIYLPSTNYYYIEENPFDIWMLCGVGETVFLIKEEAEAKLRELNTHERE